MKEFRLYARDGCQHCKAVLEQFKSAGVPIEVINIDNDPIISAGINAVTGSLFGMVPIVVCFQTKELIVGNKTEEINRAIRTYRCLGTNTLNIAD